MRKSELQGATVTAGQEGGEYSVVNVTQTKTRTSFVTLTKHRKNQLDTYIADIRPHLVFTPSDYVFAELNGKAMSSTKFSSRWRGQWTKSGGSPKISQSLLRSIAASDLAKYGSPTQRAAGAYKMGHTLRTADRFYCGLSKCSQAVDGFEAIDDVRKKRKRQMKKIKKKKKPNN